MLFQIIIVLAAIQLDHQFRLGQIEIDDVLPQRFLPIAAHTHLVVA